MESIILFLIASPTSIKNRRYLHHRSLIVCTTSTLNSAHHCQDYHRHHHHHHHHYYDHSYSSTPFLYTIYFRTLKTSKVGAAEASDVPIESHANTYEQMSAPPPNNANPPPFSWEELADVMTPAQVHTILVSGHQAQDFPPNDANRVLRHHPYIRNLVIVSTFAIQAALQDQINLVNCDNRGGVQDDAAYWANYCSQPFRYFLLDTNEPRWDPMVPLHVDVHSRDWIQGLWDFYGLLISSAHFGGIMQARHFDEAQQCVNCVNPTNDHNLRTPYRFCAIFLAGNRCCSNCFFLRARERLPNAGPGYQCDHGTWFPCNVLARDLDNTNTQRQRVISPSETSTRFTSRQTDKHD